MSVRSQSVSPTFRQVGTKEMVKLRAIIVLQMTPRQFLFETGTRAHSLRIRSRDSRIVVANRNNRVAACSISAVSLRTTIPSVNLRGADERGNALSVSVCDARDAMWYFSIILKMILIAASVAENARKEGRTSFGPCALTEGGRGLHQPCLPRNFGKNMKRHYSIIARARIAHTQTEQRRRKL